MCDTFLQKIDDSVVLFKDYLCSERNLSVNTIEAYNSDIVQFVSFIKEVSKDLIASLNI